MIDPYLLLGCFCVATGSVFAYLHSEIMETGKGVKNFWKGCGSVGAGIATIHLLSLLF